ncbi:MAG: DUF2490 domain-containing protein [Flavobacteriales bacterium]|nr:DUF2490 domain-containing protein [Flavobacteriales bacterium]
MSCCSPLRLLLAAFVVWSMITNALAQRVVDRNANVWFTYLGDHRIKEHWSIHTEAHLRRSELGASAQQLLLRPAVNFHLSGDVMFTFGYSYYHNERYGAFPIPVANWENQLYQQVQLKARYGKLGVQHRFRMEERFIATLRSEPGTASGHVFSGYAYQSRFRYRVAVTVPLSKSGTIDPGTWFFSAYDELFLNFGASDKLDHMQQNRISLLVGYQAWAQGSVQLGYLLQTIQRPGAAAGADLLEMNDTVHLLLTYDLDLRPKAGSAPGTDKR